MFSKFFRRLWHGIFDLADSSPTISQSLQACLIMGSGDYICQKFVERNKRIETKRVCTFALVGLLFVGPIVSIWIRTLERRVPKNWPPMKRAAAKMCVDQLVMAPIMLAAVLAILEVSLKNAGVDGVKKRLKSSYVEILRTNYMVWPAVQFLNFAVIPIKLQLLFAQLVGLGWNTYLSMSANK